jgi:predicted nuclease of predicted toxin-antitoxin system
VSSFLANENVPPEIIAPLRAAGIDITAIAELERGARGERVVEIARSQRRTLISFDKDFGELVYR